MVLNITSLYTDYRVNTQPDGQNPADVRRPGFVNIPKEIDTALSRDIKEMKENLKCLPEEVDRFDRRSRNLDIAEKVLLAGGMINPTCRRLNSIPKDLQEDNWQRPALLTGVAALSLPGDLREVMFAGKDIGNIFKKGSSCKFGGFARNTIANRYQHPLSFMKGTLLQPLAEKYKWLNKIDKTLYDTKFGSFVKHKLGIQESRYLAKIIGGKEVTSIKFAGGYGKKLVGRALLRIPLIGLFLATALEIPAIIKSAGVEGSFTDKIKSVGKQTLKSLGFIGLIQGGMALAGAAAVMAFPPVGAIAALVGMGIGSAAGVLASKELNKFIDDAFA